MKEVSGDIKFQPKTTRVKICGLTRLEDAQLACELGAWALGFILWPGSKRAISIKNAKVIVTELKKSVARPEKIVGVFVNPSREEINAAVSEIGLTTVQLHGDESPDFAACLPHEVIKAFRIKHRADLKQMADYHCFAHLIDAAVTGEYGGTGVTVDWDLARHVQSKVPLILSGGLNHHNIAEAIRVVQPYAVDLASGVEASPGIKDPRLLKQLFAEID